MRTPKRFRRSAVVTKTRIAEVRVVAGTCTSYSSCKAAKTLQLFPYKVRVIQQLLPPECEKRHHYWVVACRSRGWPSHIRRDFFPRWVVVQSHRLC
jgi:hypothetical protein